MQQKDRASPCLFGSGLRVMATGKGRGFLLHGGLKLLKLPVEEHGAKRRAEGGNIGVVGYFNFAECKSWEVKRMVEGKEGFRGLGV